MDPSAKTAVRLFSIGFEGGSPVRVDVGACPRVGEGVARETRRAEGLSELKLHSAIGGMEAWI